MLNEYSSKAVDAYTQMNEIYERDPLDEKMLQLLVAHLVNTRFRMIELIGTLQTNQVIKKKKFIQ